MSKTIFISGNFNILHPGHLRLMRFARELGDELIVGVYSDSLGGESAHVPEEMRLEGVQSNIWVTKAVLIDNIKDAINLIKPDIIVKGKEHENQYNIESDIVNEYGGALIFSSGEVVFSSLDLIRRDLSGNHLTSIQFPEKFAARHGFNKSDLTKVVNNFSSLKVCVVGDLIVDEYITCDPLGLSKEDPTIVVTPIANEKFVGGAGIVAAHAAGLGAEVKLISVGGDDDTRLFAEESLKSFSVDANILVDETRPTSLKQRFRAEGKTLLRVSHLHQGSISQSIQELFLESATAAIRESDILIFSDFNYGCLPQQLVEQLISIAKENNVHTAADSQSSSQIGDIARYKNMDFLFPTEHEARISLRNYDDGIVVLSEKLSKLTNAKNIILKLGSEGALLHLDDGSAGSKTDRLAPMNFAPKDVAGAGDSMMMSTMLGFVAGADVWQAACIGGVAAALQISRVGNIPLQKNELLDCLK